MKKTLYIASAIGFIIANNSCQKVLEQDPESYLDATTAFTTKEAVASGVIGIYDQFQSTYYTGVDYMILPELQADNLSHTGSYSNYLEVKNRIITTSNTSIVNDWNYIYAGINRANNVIYSAGNITDASFTNKATLIGEARFLRAYMYFDLLRFYGGDSTGYASSTGVGVPLRLTPTYTSADAQPIARSSSSEILDQIIKDVDSAIANLSTTHVNGRADKNVARAFKSRVLLYRNQFDSAEAYATQIISQYSASTTYGGLAADYASIYTTKNTTPESIWELQNTASDGTYLGYYYYGRSEVATATDLANAHETGDLRKTVNYNNSVSSTKYRQLKFTRTDYSDNIPLIRLAEIYLNRAEARVRKETSDLTGAAADLNIVRARAGLTATTATTAEELLTAIQKERRIELAHEGHRFFDLRRWQLAKSTLGITETYRLLWPLPQSEVDASAGVVKQNTGY